MIWAVLSPNKLSYHARACITDPSNTVLVSVIGAWEISIQSSVGRWPLPENAPQRIRLAYVEADFAFIPVTVDHADEERHLPWLHREPFDRMLVAQARLERCHPVTNDRAISAYPVDVLW